MVGIGKEIIAATTGLKASTMYPSRCRAAVLEPAAWAQARSKPLEKNFPLDVVTRADPGVAWALARESAESMESMTDGPNRCSSWSEEPVKPCSRDPPELWFARQLHEPNPREVQVGCKSGAGVDWAWAWAWACERAERMELMTERDKQF
ncbi:hypothetical protein OWV82_006103 [Melia azedarach]|uniref:Uncharacterized protein n=1 Tax=Melia azedarach TaxID=155640 RepID=A0ACC1YI04_MELAZ|nr:hypothetical protein OWV82_006103 [Melia azedarach]